MAQDKHRYAERRRFFLDTAGIGQQQISTPHQVDKRQVIEWLDQRDIWFSAQDGIDRTGDVRVAVHRPDDLHIFAFGKASDGAAEILEVRAEAFAAVRGDDDQLLAGVERNVEAGMRAAFEAVADHRHRVDSSIAGDFYPPGRDAFANGIACDAFGGRAMQLGYGGGEN